MSLITSIRKRLGMTDTPSAAPAPWSHFPAESKIFISSVEHSGIEQDEDVATLLRSSLRTRYGPFVTDDQKIIPTIGMYVYYLEIGNVAMVDAAEFNGGDKSYPVRRHYYKEYNDGIIFLVDATDGLNKYVEEYFRRVVEVEGNAMDGKPALFLYCWPKKPEVGEKKQEDPERSGRNRDGEPPWTMEEVEKMVGEGTGRKGGRSLGAGRKWTIMNAYLDSGEGVEEGLAWLGHAVAEVKGNEKEKRDQRWFGLSKYLSK